MSNSNDQWWKDEISEATKKKFHERKDLLSELTEKYKQESHCISDQILLYLRYLTDELAPRDKEFKECLDNLYKKFRLIHATNPEKMGRWQRPSTIAANLFYLAVRDTAKYVTMKQIADRLHICESPMRKNRIFERYLNL